MDQFRIIEEYFSRKPGIAAVYLYGSAASGKEHKHSDLDIALLYKEGEEPEFNEQLQIVDDLTSSLGKEIDLLILNGASPIIRMQVLKKGKKMIERDRKETNRFFVQTINEYCDLKITRSVIEQNINKARIYG
ncbi:MAG: nucleotidyltransferase domain-containing protein [Balneolaceae bacterium]|nr:nucleotidyltransferase domain-containing protein [Balneolaceae bacterium]